MAHPDREVNMRVTQKFPAVVKLEMSSPSQQKWPLGVMMSYYS
jgi:hypothetical protein